MVELLGDDRGEGIRQHLGYELVEITRQPLPADVTTELGEVLTPYPDVALGDAGLFPSPCCRPGRDLPSSSIRRAAPSRSITPRARR